MIRYVRLLLSWVLILLGSGLASAQPEERSAIHSGPELDYQPSIIRVGTSDVLLMAIERLTPQTLSGDLYISSSADNGVTWTIPQSVIASASNERHPALVQLGPQSFAMFYLSNASGGFRIHRATSIDGLTWMPQGALDLGWSTPGEINPAVIVAPDTTLTMTYQRLGTLSTTHLAQSTDGGVTWDLLKTEVAPGQLPRLTQRTTDGLYLITYQVGSSAVKIYAKTSPNPYDWSGPAFPLSVDANSHDAAPIVLEDGTFLVPYVKAVGSASFNVVYRTSRTGQSWSGEMVVTQENAGDVEPHPLLTGVPGRVMLAWGRPVSESNYDIWLERALIIPADLASSHLTVSDASFTPGATLTYTLTMQNTGIGPSTGQVSATVPLSSTIVLDSLQASAGMTGYDATTDTITWTGLLGVDTPVTVTFALQTEHTLPNNAVLAMNAQLHDDQGHHGPFNVISTAIVPTAQRIIYVPLLRR